MSSRWIGEADNSLRLRTGFSQLLEAPREEPTLSEAKRLILEKEAVQLDDRVLQLDPKNTGPHVFAARVSEEADAKQIVSLI
jgi:hypothetical protein